MFKIFVVEDEPLIRKGIIKYIERGGKDEFQVVGSCGDGELAYPQILETKPDLIITDVRMPYMNGLELAREVRKKLLHVKIIIISGYEEFQYANEAIQIGVVAYLVKPILEKPLLDSIRKAQMHSRQENNSSKERENLEQHFFEDLITRGHTLVELYKEAEDLKVSLAAVCYNIILVGGRHCDYYNTQNGSEEGGLSREKLKMALEGMEGILFQYGARRYAVLVKGKQAQEAAASTDRIVKLILKLCQPQDYYIGVGKPVSRLSEIPDSYEQAEWDYAYCYFSSKTYVHLSGEADKPLELLRDMPEFAKIDTGKMNRDAVETFLRKGKKSEVREFIDDYFTKIGNDAWESYLFRWYIVIDMEFAAAAFLRWMDDGEPEQNVSVEEIYKCIRTQEGMYRFISNLLERCIEYRDRKSGNVFKGMIDQAKQFIREHYSEEISLNRVAAHIGVSQSYLSRVFGQETGKTFVNYLTQVRMEYIKEQLRCTDKSIEEICHEAGYKDTHYFYALFKKREGCTPTDYRMQRER